MSKPKTAKFNVILITIDSLRADFVDSYIDGEKDKIFTPNLFKFAQNSIVFKNAFANAPYTAASFATLFTSKYPSLAISSRNTLRANCITIADILRSHEYCTIGIHSNPLLSSNFGFDKGFDYFEDNILPWNKDTLPKKYHRVASKITRLFKKEAYLSANVINHKAISYLKRADTPFFLWIHYMDTHGPYQSKKGFSYLNKYKAELLWRKAIKRPHKITDSELNSLRSSYLEEIKYIDHYLGEFLTSLDKIKLLKNSIIVICSDHGDAFNEHGFFSHPRQLYDELIKVPLIIKLPDMAKRRIISRPVSLINIVATILDYLGLSVKKYHFSGESLLPLLENENLNRFPHWIISEATPDKEHQHTCIRTKQWKLIIVESSNRKELYNLKEDPEEQVNMVGTYLEIEKELEKKLSEYKCKRKSIDAKYIDDDKAFLDKEMKKRLKSLGYF